MKALFSLALCSCLSLAHDFPPANMDGRCHNGVLDGAETGVDCGGAECERCVIGSACSVDVDCESGLCDAGVCIESRCNDNKRGGRETDVDCGGDCVPCAAGKACQTSNDCVFAVCAMQTCESTQQRIAGAADEVAFDGKLLAAKLGADIILWDQTVAGLVMTGTVSSTPLSFTVTDETLFLDGVDVYDKTATRSGPLGPTGVSGYGVRSAAGFGVVAVASSERVHVFVKSGAAWTEQAELEGEAIDVAVTATTLAVAGPTAVSVFARKGTAWMPEQTIAVAAKRVALAGGELLAATDSATLHYHRVASAWGLAQTLPPAKRIALTDGIAALSDDVHIQLYYWRADRWMLGSVLAGGAVALTPTRLVVSGNDLLVFGHD